MTRLTSTIGMLLLLLMFLSSCEQEKESKAVQIPKKRMAGTIIALGDSLTAGLGVDIDKCYPALLEQKLKDAKYNYRVINAGVSGETSSGTLSRLNWILSQEPDIVILEIGANDGFRGIDTALAEKNIREILSVLQKKGIVTILAGMKMVWNMGEEYTTRFNRIYPKLTEETGVIFMPFFLDGVATLPELNNADGIHPNHEGYKHITDNLYPYVLLAIEKHRLQQ